MPRGICIGGWSFKFGLAEGTVQGQDPVLALLRLMQGKQNIGGGRQRAVSAFEQGACGRLDIRLTHQALAYQKRASAACLQTQ